MLHFWVLREINLRFCSKTQWQMLLLISGRHVGAHLGGHQHGVSIQISINLGKTFIRISPIRKLVFTWIVASVFAYLPSFYFQILDLIYGTVLIFYFDLFWMAWHWKPAIVENWWKYCRKKKPIGFLSFAQNCSIKTYHTNNFLLNERGPMQRNQTQS